MENTIEVPILKHIGNDTKLGRGFMAEDITTATKGYNFDTVRFLLTSPGGSVEEGKKMSAIVAALRSEGKKIHMLAIGPVASIATVFMMEGDLIEAEPYAKFMIHKASLPKEHAQEIYGNSDQLREQAEAIIQTVDAIDQTLIATYKSKRKLKNSDKLFSDYYVNEKWMTPQEALSFGLIDRVKLETQNFFIPTGVKVQTILGEMDQVTVPQESQTVTTPAMAYESYLPQSKGYLRSEMPQIASEDMELFAQYFSIQLGFEHVTHGQAPAKDLLPAQIEFNKDKILSKQSEGTWSTRTYIISSDSFLLDGHHDWAAALETDPYTPLQFMKVDLPIDKLIKEANKLKITISEPV